MQNRLPTKKTYKPTSNALHKFCKIVVTSARSGLLAKLSYPRLNVLCNSCTTGDVLWLPMAIVRQVNCDDATHSPRHETNIPSLDAEFHDQSTFCFDDPEETRKPCPFTHLEDLAYLLSFVPNGEVERHIEVVWKL
jgi:hypothetical protein